jgi:predicted secreted protein
MAPRIFLKAAFCAALTVLFAAAAGIRAETHLDARAEMRLDISEEKVEGYAGDEMTITLISNRTTGYGWEISEGPDEKVAEFVRSEYVPNSDIIVGSGGRDVFVFRAVSAGKTKASFKYVRPWEEDSPQAKTEKYTIVVKERGLKA